MRSPGGAVIALNRIGYVERTGHEAPGVRS
jgi:hypothetical protein